jgi:hypothetical protein
MAKKKKKNEVQLKHDPTIEVIVEHDEKLPVRDDDPIRRTTDSRPSWRPPVRKHHSIPPGFHRIEIDLAEDRPLTDPELDKLITDIVDEQASRKRNVRILPSRVVRVRRKCEKAKAARRAAAFKSGSAGPGKKTIPMRKHRC